MAGQMAGPNWLIFFNGTMVTQEVTLAKKFNKKIVIFSIFLISTGNVCNIITSKHFKINLLTW